MLKKLKSIGLFVMIFGVSCFALNLIGINAFVNAQDTETAVSTEPTGETKTTDDSKPADCPLKKIGHPECKSHEGVAHHGCSKKTGESCAHKSCEGGDHGCSNQASACGTDKCCDNIKKGCGKETGSGHSVDSMLGLVHCAKKELLKEKMKKSLNKKIGKKLDKVAELLVDAMLEEYKAGRASDERKAELQNKLLEIYKEEKK